MLDIFFTTLIAAATIIIYSGIVRKVNKKFFLLPALFMALSLSACGVNEVSASPKEAPSQSASLFASAASSSPSGVSLGDSTASDNLRSTDRGSILRLAEMYYKETKMEVESDFFGEFFRLVPKEPDFSGNTKDEALVVETSLQVAGSIFTCNARNFNLACAAAMFAHDPDSVTAAVNFAAGIACYFDNNIFDSLGDFRGQADNAYYRNAETVYLYAVEISKADGGHSRLSLIPLASLGNLYIDMGRAEEALPLFDAARAVDPCYTPAVNGKRKALA